VAKVEPVHITETNVLWTASVVDTLKYCVINAKSIAVMNASFPKEKNITREVSFKVKNKEGEGKTVNSTITGVAEWNGVKCYTVLLDVGMNFQTHKVYRKVDCILADLENDEFKLYIGKNWLGDDMKVK
jgi:predicted CoA-binding protein